MIYQYEAMDACGREVKDEVVAQNMKVAQASIRDAGLFVTKITKKRKQKLATATELEGKIVEEIPKNRTFNLDESDPHSSFMLGVYLGVAVTIGVTAFIALLWLMFR